MKTNTQKTVKEKILNALVKHSHNGVLTLREIAELAYPDTEKEFKKHAEGLVKRNIAHAMALGSEQGFVTVIIKKPCVNPKKVARHAVIGYKIVGWEDQQIIKEATIDKDQRAKIYLEKQQEFLEDLEKNNLLSDETKKALNEHNEPEE